MQIGTSSRVTHRQQVDRVDWTWKTAHFSGIRNSSILRSSAIPSMFILYIVIETRNIFCSSKCFYSLVQKKYCCLWTPTALAEVADHEVPHQALRAFASLGADGSRGANVERDLHRWLKGLWGVEIQTYTIEVPLQVLLEEYIIALSVVVGYY